MSSNIEVVRVCQHCSKEFIAKTTVTKYCDTNCAKRAYKIRKRKEKIVHSNIETAKINGLELEEIGLKQFLSVRDASKLLCCSRQAVYKMINSGKLKAVNLMEKKTIIKRTDLDELFN